MTSNLIHPQVRLGHVHLTVSHLERSVRFYREALGLEVTQRYGSSAAFLSAGGYHHHLGLNTWAGEGAPPPPAGRTGLYHFALLYPSRIELARAFKRLFDHGIPIEGASDHGVSEAIYLRDPDGNGIELYHDRDPAEWPRIDGKLTMTTQPLDLDDLLSELLTPDGLAGEPPASRSANSHPNPEPNPETMKTTLTVSESTFEQDVLRSSQPVVVDFWAEWCGPCKMLGPVLEEVAREFDGRAVVAKVNVDENPKLAARFGIQSIPALLYFQGGQLRDQSVGVVSRKTIAARLQALAPGTVPASAA